MVKPSTSSRAVRSVEYSAAERCLYIEFESGGRYRYRDVPASVHEWLLRAPNKGVFIARKINGQFAHERLDGPAATVDLVAALQASLGCAGSAAKPGVAPEGNPSPDVPTSIGR